MDKLRILMVGLGVSIGAAGAVMADVRTSWVATYDSPARGEDVFVDIAFDSAGNAIVAGWTITEATYYDFLITKYDHTGKLLWTRTWDGPEHGEDWIYAVVVDSADDIYVQGNSKSAATNWDPVTQKYNSDGQLLWERSYDGPVHGEDGSFGADMIGLDAAGNAYVAGYTEVENGAFEFVTLKYTSTGDLEWMRTYAGSPNCAYAYGYALAVSPAGNVYVSGPVGTDSCYSDLELVVYDTEGNELWTAAYDGPAQMSDSPYGLTIDDEGNAYIAGISDTSGGYQAALMKFTPTGDGNWVQIYGGERGYHYSFAVAIDADHNAFMTGASQSGGGQYDIFTLKANADGSLGWVQRYWADNWWAEDWAYDIEAAADGSVYVVGNVWTGFSSDDDAVTLKYDANGTLLWDEVYNGEGSGYDGMYCVELADDGSLYAAGWALGDSGAADGLLIKFLEAPCTGGESIDSADCQESNGINKMVVKLSGGLPGDPFTVALSSGETKSGTVKDNGRGKAKFKNLPGGAGTATATWGCGAEASQGYDCP